MRFCYIDESGTPDIPGNTSHYVLARLSMPVDKWKSCESEIQHLKVSHQLQNAEIHTGWLLWPIFEQSKIINFEQLNYAERKYEIEKYRNAELLRLQKLKNKKLYHKTKKNYRASI